jgi:hypothetical protein
VLRGSNNLILPMLLALSLVGCATPRAPADTRSKPAIRELPNGMVVERRVGTIEQSNSQAGVNVPDSVARGEEFVVEVTTWGSDCVGKGDMEVQVTGLSIVLTPYDWEVIRLPPNTGCRVAVIFHEHTASLRFDQPGEGRVVVRGRRKPSGEVITVERRIEVR